MRSFIRSNIANALTSARILGAVLILFTGALTPAFYVIYTLCGVTDALDGYAARKTGSAGETGARLDSVADVLFCAAALLRVVPVLWAALPKALLCAAGAVLLLRLCAYLAALIRFRRLGVTHTYANKLTGLLLFLVPYAISAGGFTALMWVVCGVAACSAAEELLLNISAAEFDPERKTILARSKPRSRRATR